MLSNITPQIHFCAHMKTPHPAIVRPTRVKSQHMKLKNLIPQRFRQQNIRRFGRATLVKLPNGQHQLIGGTDADRTAAYEWVSLFAHEIVFTHFLREAEAQKHSRPARLNQHFQHAL